MYLVRILAVCCCAAVIPLTAQYGTEQYSTVTAQYQSFVLVML